MPCHVNALDGRAWWKRVVEDVCFITLVSDNLHYPLIHLMKDQVT
jgi:hypothetical protein